MCGIAGIISSSPNSDHSAKNQLDLQSMTAALVHRGPDGEGLWKNPGEQVFLGHRRLAVIDTSEAAAQPMHFQNRYTIIYNGEIYNYIELRQDLQKLGYQFHTASDTEVILTAFHEFRENCLEKFDGMFALAIWDELEQQLFLARDRFGEKPLFFHTDTLGRFLFASEMKAFWAIGIPRQMEEGQVLLYLATGTTGFPLEPSRSFYKNIFQVPAASFVFLRPENANQGALSASRYWDIDITRQSVTGIESATQQISAMLDHSVKIRLRADVKAGSSLSSGIDSASIAESISRHHSAGFESFSAVFPGFEKDESVQINELTRLLKLKNHQTSPAADDLVSSFERLIYHQEQPIVSASVLVQYKVFELARQEGVTVLLDGQGADELFGGYRHYLHWFLQEQWRAGNWSRKRKELALFRQNGWKPDWGFKNLLAASFPQAAQSQLIKKQANQIRMLSHVNSDYKTSFFSEQDLYKPLVTSLNDILYFDLTMGKLPELLRYADRNSMSFGRELRLPFLDHALVEFVFSLPPEYKMRDGYNKWILRKTMDGKLPDATAWQKKKIAYEPPQQSWMNTPSVKENIMEARKKLVNDGILNKRVLSVPYRAAETDDLNNIEWRYWVLAAL
jgi:asparagine synthase (glutamine-hydrolysing)